jgi:hypothetical protein
VTFWDALSVVTLAAASLPSIYFAAKTWNRHRGFAHLSAMLVGALLVHAAYHLSVVLSLGGTVVLAMEAASAALILAFAILYWKGRERLP